MKAGDEAWLQLAAEMQAKGLAEEHPLKPFLPDGGRVLFLGSFPPPREKWSMDFFYPNFINDFWRIWGLLYFDDKTYFELPVSSGRRKAFNQKAIEDFARDKGMAFFDTAQKVCRLKGNASDDFLHIVEPTDVGALLTQLPDCHTLVTTGGKASEQLLARLSEAQETTTEKAPSLQIPAVGTYSEWNAFGRTLRWYRMPSSSRAFPMPIEQKAARYRILMPLLR